MPLVLSNTIIEWNAIVFEFHGFKQYVLQCNQFRHSVVLKYIFSSFASFTLFSLRFSLKTNCCIDLIS